MTPPPTPMEPLCQPFTLPFAAAFGVTSAAGAEYRVSVGVPMSYEDTEQPYPVLYVLDADAHFCTVLEICRERGRIGEIAELIVVGIGYPLGTDYPTWASRRLHDFTVVDGERTSRAVDAVERRLASLGKTLELGGAPALLALITDTIQPLVNVHYRTSPLDQGICGHSAGGNFVAHALLSEPAAFSKHIAGSPSFAFDDAAVLAAEAAFARSHVDFPATVYLAAASAEARQMADTGIVSGTARLAEALEQRGYPNLNLTCEFFLGRSHASVHTDLVQRGLEVCWPGVPYQLSSLTSTDDARDAESGAAGR